MPQDLTIITMGEEGQIIIPEQFRKKIGLTAPIKFKIVYNKNTRIIKILQIPDSKQDRESIFRKTFNKNLNISEEDVLDEIQKYRKEKHTIQ